MAGFSSLTGAEARLRAGYGVNPWLSVGAEAFAQKRDGQALELGGLVEATAHF